ncbi:potassium-transporting ATPase subunit KdpC [Rubellimicrobium roseum]|uniref:Potassium-transporting ATPase KdpC subunit n=1 Tax=Rubellimicrobium roseum TaxID=687525 RepID=A0A5C4NEM2_9RHOB|nr:potassium-transporting ATPase subunit KdpC [Rubellimicrobium roseum]TNC73093.1 potassium-transporting ATPase subunit KdpC [Rubellimicrobium roseum]
MLAQLRPAIMMMVFFTLLTGLIYPLTLTGIMGAVAPSAARGSLLERDGVVIGSSLIGQSFVGTAYLHPRASASDWNAAGTGATNLGPTSAQLVADVQARREAFAAENGLNPDEVPIDAVTTSGSGLDPDVSPANALGQAERIAAARRADPTDVRALIADHVEGRWLGLYGEPRVNVLLTNLALDQAFPLAAGLASN